MFMRVISVEMTNEKNQRDKLMKTCYMSQLIYWLWGIYIYWGGKKLEKSQKKLSRERSGLRQEN